MGQSREILRGEMTKLIRWGKREWEKSAGPSVFWLGHQGWCHWETGRPQHEVGEIIKSSFELVGTGLQAITGEMASCHLDVLVCSTEKAELGPSWCGSVD